MRQAVFSDDGMYRYTLPRSLPPGGQGRCVFVMLNPSTATDVEDDATTTRCMRYATRWGYAEYVAVNLFAFRATRPADMKAADDPVGPENDRFLLEMTGAADLVVAAWGVHGAHRVRDKAVRALLNGQPLHVLGLNKGGSPKHPLYLGKDVRPVLWGVVRWSLAGFRFG